MIAATPSFQLSFNSFATWLSRRLINKVRFKVIELPEVMSAFPQTAEELKVE